MVSHGKQEMIRTLRRSVLPFVRRRSSFVVIAVVVRSEMLNVDGKIKKGCRSEKEAKE
jgi:hypothetical protein